MTCSSKNF